ncbi:UDP-N-acetylmuramoyl-tripeptide--D-alanyl-D-alanine ligase [Desulfohalotomaculum tongense]|uniref:UDP-N-acetylmuramoyl-tripeptide--D-alanyl-D- alanine ligase n=1 Tax=Desulforadius tongensis TaxID=1216062 RepID=UPI00195BF17A|nr:UDP-N-acetylmuramoyl-tripeptide--D-alanyl-D-alanine ligase [Desulforadius tongensis]MBM7855935.1 UDP-N-acetylmuramoyl-tripeptide--D-alanyl-D-alanine ligase [Desulforadius tongensis]
MKKFTIKEIASAVDGKLIQGDPQQLIENVCTDTRKLQRGDLFFALVGEKHDGHHYARQAAESGAGGLVLGKPVAGIPTGVPVIMVQHTLTALQQLAAYNRSQFNIPVIGITGSNGKTTTKDLVAAVLGQKYQVLKTKGNFNNEIGLPLTLLQLNQNYNAAVLEMGMRGLGQIDELCRIAGITAAVITNIGETHLELLGSVENIAKAKGEILKHVPGEGFALIPAASDLAREQARHCPGRVYTFGVNTKGDYTATAVKCKNSGSSFTANTPGGKITVQLPIPGRHNVSNAMAALAVGMNLGLTLDQCAAGLAEAEISAMRLQIIQSGEITIINDAYNANPDSTRAALAALNDLAGGRRQVAVLGSMFELGTRERQGHYETGKAASQVDLLVTVGELARNIAAGAREAGLPSNQVHWFADNRSAVSFLKKFLLPGDIVLVKGSRGMHLEEVVEAIENIEKN